MECRFFLVQVGERWLVAAMPPNFKGDVIVGELRGSRHNLWHEAWDKVTKETASIHQGKLLPYYLHGYADYRNLKYALYLGGGLAGFGLFLILVAAWGYFRGSPVVSEAETAIPFPSQPVLGRAFAKPINARPSR